MPSTISRVRVVPDTFAESPREWDNLGVFAGWHRNYVIGDEQPDCEPQEWLKDNAPPGSVVLSVYMIDHGAVHYSTSAFSDPWDSGQVGYIVATPDKIRECFMKKRISKKTREQVARILKSEIEIYDSWANGDIWGYVIEEADGEHPTETDSCYGFYGDDIAGMKDHVSKELHPLLEKAWEARFDHR